MASADETLIDRIQSNPGVLGGKPVIRGTRIPVSLILNFVANEMTSKEILEEYPQLEEQDIRAALFFAEKVTAGEGVLNETPSG